MFTHQANFLSAMGWAVLNSLWQLALLWLVYQFILFIQPKTSAAFKSKLASLFLIAGFGWFLLTFFFALNSTIAGEPVFNTRTLINTAGSWAFLQKIIQPISIVYLLLLFIPLSRFIKNYRYVQVIRRHGLQKADAQWRLFVSNISRHMNIGPKVEVWVSSFITSPVTVGWLKPVILLPAAVVTQLTTRQVEALLLHELAHIRRLDYLVNLVLNFIRTVLYFNPFATAFIKIVEREREKNCDEIVLQFQYNPHEYATALLRIQQASNAPQGFVLAATGRNELLQRVQLIMGLTPQKTFSGRKITSLISGGLAGIFFLSVLLLHKPKQGIESVSNIPAAFYKNSLFSYKASTQTDLAAENKNPALNEQKTAGKTPVASKEINDVYAARPAYPEMAENYKLAGYELAEAFPELSKYQEEQIRQTVEASKKVLTAAQWSAAEKELAEVFSQNEKKAMRKKYQQQIEKFDWKSWEQRLKTVYDKVDWDNVNSQIGEAMNIVRLDSLKQVYADAVAILDKARKELVLDSLKSVPDTDISLKTIDQKIKAAITALSNINASKKKKIVRL